MSGTTVVEIRQVSKSLARWGEGGKSYNLDGPVPGARDKGIFVYRIPANRKSLSLVLMEVHNGEVI